MEAHVRENNRQEAPTKEKLKELDYLKDLEFFATTCKILNIAMEVKKTWARRRLKPWFRANMSAWLYESAKKHMWKHSSVYSSDARFLHASECSNYRNKKNLKDINCDRREEEKILVQDFDRNVTLCLRNSFYRNSETTVDPLPCCKD